MMVVQDTLRPGGGSIGLALIAKHCQRHNGPKVSVHITTVGPRYCVQLASQRRDRRHVDYS